MTFFLPYITRDSLEYIFLFDRSADGVAAMMIHVVMHLYFHYYVALFDGFQAVNFRGTLEEVVSM